MTPKYPMYVIGAALLSLAPYGFAKAQAQKLSSFINSTPPPLPIR